MSAPASHPITARRIVAIWLPQMAMEHWRNTHREWDMSQPLALISEGAHGMVVDAVNDVARHAGAKPGQRLTDARAICPTLAVHSSDHAQDAQMLARLGLWAQRWSPWSAVDGSDALLLDTTGSAHLFGGEAAMLDQMHSAFARLGFTSRIAIAPSVGAAWALAHFGAASPAIAGDDDLARQLAPLPIESLRIEGDTALLLRRLGLKTVGTLADIPVQALARRFRQYKRQIANPLKRLQQAYGQVEEVIEPLSPRRIFRAVRRASEPVRYVSILQPILDDLARQLCQLLEGSQRGVRRVCFQAFRVDGHIARLEVETAASTRSPRHIAQLFSQRIETLDAGFGFDAFVLTALWHEPMQPLQQGLADAGKSGQNGESDQAIPLAHLLDRLRTRLGQSSAGPLAPCASHIPERAIIWDHKALASLPLPDRERERERERPLKLLDRPEPVTVIYATPDGPPRRFRWRHQLHSVAKSSGPERIAPEWWRERSGVRLRDYYKVEDDEGRRFWLYRNGVVDDGRGPPPRWFLHGLFA